ncbi:hypothetical protein [Candidatus Poriferisocius sp.]|uniref:hypothetical protein n=1 Tax=Candidatus Poriferisocius sp. TaxID=3101276 RepID=UPI003B02AA65
MARNPLKGLVNFLRLLRHMPPEGYRPDTTQIREATKAAFPPRAGGVGGASGGALAGSRKTDKIIGKAIADSHKKARR